MGACLGKPQADDPAIAAQPVKKPVYNAAEQQFAQMSGIKVAAPPAPPRPAPPAPPAEEEHKDDSSRAAYSNKSSQKVAAEEEEDEFIPVLPGKEEKGAPPPVMYGGGAVVDSMSVRGGIRAMGVGSMHGPSAAGGAGGSGRGSSLAMRAVQAASIRASKTAMEFHNVRVLGTGNELLLFAHGIGYNMTMWDPVLQAFDLSSWRIILFDLNGALGSNYDAFDPQRYNTLHGFAEDLLGLLEELGVKGDSGGGTQCTFVGYQQAGLIAMLASLERPGIFSRIICVESSPRLLNGRDYKGSFQLSDLDQVFGVMQGNFNMWVRGCAPVFTADDVKALHVRSFTGPLFRLRSDVGFCTLKTVFACDIREILPKVTTQTHFLFYTTTPVPQPTIQMMLANVPNAFAEIIDGSGPDTAGPQTAAAIMRHLNMPLRDTSGLSHGRRIFRLNYAEDE